MTRLQPTGRSRLCSAGLIAAAADLYGLFVVREKHCSMAEKVGLILAYKLKRTEPWNLTFHHFLKFTDMPI